MLKPVNSNTVQCVGYDSVRKELHVVFHASHEKNYVYKNVSKDVYDDFLKADSKGGYFHSNIKNNYSHTVKSF